MKDLIDAGFVLEQSISGSAGYKLTEKFLAKIRTAENTANVEPIRKAEGR
jgi:hypothetical protein